jgi:alanyl-tRNA synthetase
MSFSAIVADIVEERREAGRQRWQVLLDRTEFRAGDVGTLEAVARSGARLSVPVLGVVERDGELWHQVEKPLLQETEVTGHVFAAPANG